MAKGKSQLLELNLFSGKIRGKKWERTEIWDRSHQKFARRRENEGQKRPAGNGYWERGKLRGKGRRPGSLKKSDSGLEMEFLED